MPQQEKDKSSKWLIQNHGGALLRLAGSGPMVRWQALQSELVQPRKLPDGLLEVYFPKEKTPRHYLLEIATYPEKRLMEQVVDDMMLAFQHFRKMPEVLTVILAQKGKLQITGTHTLPSKHGWADLTVRWKVVEMWKLSAEELLSGNDVGLIPWVPLTQFSGPPADLFQRCRKKILDNALPNQKENLLAVSHVLASIRYNDVNLLSLFGGEEKMTEFPAIQRLINKKTHKFIISILEGRFGEIPQDLVSRIKRISKESRLEDLVRFAALCKTVDEFRNNLQSKSKSS